ncbi:DUF1176 domain-containing protein [Erwinia sorbitola]|uniref:DUF1176 domain-containing protein n=1 Tax=Erwinia sorbitola TaxID=2681984 RepID=A0A6I6EXE1_9GAMM|nr:DUF1176 domain-containing protein [Erwinia sorbitola]MTD29378.1 DUF1176 domain-containing protein [Erwinia sorbitola]QGU89312.1 DUF1176 domain-containing protein [Erwinia sorbitola]
MQNKKVLLALVLLGLNSGAQAEEWVNAPVQKVFKNWQVTCNNLNDCEVRNTDETLRIILKRKAGADSQPSLSFQQWGDRKPEGIWLDGKPWHSAIEISPSKTSDDYSAGGSDKLADIQQWVQASKNALTVALTPGSEAASLGGLNAALLLVDERQGRLNNQTALLKVGNNEPSMVPARPVPAVLNFPVPAVVPVTNEAVLIDTAIAVNKKLLSDESCEPDQAARERSEALPLNDRQALVIVNCGLGAYQSSSILFISSRDQPEETQQLTLALPDNDDQGKPRVMSWFTEATYDPQTAELYYSGRGRGIADCGDNGSWKYDGKTFHLAAYNSQPSCDGGEPGDWPSVWATAGTP